MNAALRVLLRGSRVGDLPNSSGLCEDYKVCPFIYLKRVMRKQASIQLLDERELCILE